MNEKEYLGDSVYARIESGMIELTTWNGYPDDPRNTIVLELETYEHLIRYVTRAKEYFARRQAEEDAKARI